MSQILEMVNFLFYKSLLVFLSTYQHQKCEVIIPTHDLYSWQIMPMTYKIPPVVIGLQCTQRHCDSYNDPFISFPSIGDSITKSFILHHSQKSARPIDLYSEHAERIFAHFQTWISTFPHNCSFRLLWVSSHNKVSLIFLLVKGFSILLKQSSSCNFERIVVLVSRTSGFLKPG